LGGSVCGGGAGGREVWVSALDRGSPFGLLLVVVFDSRVYAVLLSPGSDRRLLTRWCSAYRKRGDPGSSGSPVPSEGMNSGGWDIKFPVPYSFAKFSVSLSVSS
jgi:hypothetical protein